MTDRASLAAPSTTPPEAWAPARQLAARVLKPLDRFLHVEASSGIVLLVAALAALVWANSPWGASYERLWNTPVTVGVGSFVAREPLHFWVNDGLMAIFFFVVGLEIRREIHAGELSERKRAALPVAAALGGLIAPAIIFSILNRVPPGRNGWGVPTATDIAFALGVLALLGKRVAPAMRVLLLALAVIDDLGAIVVIAVFYSSGVAWSGLAIAALGTGVVLVMQRFGVRRSLAYVLPAVIIWGGMLKAGVHPTIAGVILGLLTPVRTWFGQEGFVAVSSEVLEELRARAEQGGARNGEGLLEQLRRIRQAHREAVPPVVRLQHALHPWVAYGIMPIFALANAGVRLEGLALDDPTAKTIVMGVVLGLVLGKPIGIFTASFVTVHLGICVLPRGVGWTGVLVVGAVGGIGFTMAIFIAGLAFPGAGLLGAAKLGVLLGSLVAAIGAMAFGRIVLPAEPAPGAALTAHEAETSTEQ